MNWSNSISNGSNCSTETYYRNPSMFSDPLCFGTPLFVASINFRFLPISDSNVLTPTLDTILLEHTRKSYIPVERKYPLLILINVWEFCIKYFVSASRRPVDSNQPHDTASLITNLSHVFMIKFLCTLRFWKIRFLSFLGLPDSSILVFLVNDIFRIDLDRWSVIKLRLFIQSSDSACYVINLSYGHIL